MMSVGISNPSSFFSRDDKIRRNLILMDSDFYVSERNFPVVRSAIVRRANEVAK